MLSATFNDRLLSHTSASTRATPPILAPDRPQRCGFRVQSVSSSPGRVVKATPIRAAGIPDRVVAHACGNGSNPSVKFVETTNETQFVAETLLPTRTGNYRLRGYRHTVDEWLSYTEPAVVVSGRVEDQENVPVRVHDACFTSEVLGSLKCDCAQQLQLALEYIRRNPPGMIIYLHQEGRGIGLANKIAAYKLQEKGLDTVDANRALGLPDDCREYTAVHGILKDLRIKSIQLMTNNPRKLAMLEELGVHVSGRIPCIVKAGEHNKGYLLAKQERMGHQLNGSWCYWNHEEEGTQHVEGHVKQGSILPSSASVSGAMHLNVTSRE